MLGLELWTKLGKPDFFSLWRATQNSADIFHTPFANHYLRVDKHDHGRPRLSPSILRAYLTYTIISLAKHAKDAAALAETRRAHHAEVSQRKRLTAERLVTDALDPKLLSQASVLICGDIVRDMAHDVARPESSTGELVRGSDIDLIFVTYHRDEAVEKDIEDAVLAQKHIYLRHPDYREEVDFKVRPIAEYLEAVRFRDPKDVIAVKVLLEARRLAGSPEPWRHALQLVSSFDAMQKINALTEKAFSDRMKSIERLRKDTAFMDEEAYRKIFFFSEEYWEFALAKDE